MKTRSAKPMRPPLETGASRFMMLERAVEEEHRPHMLPDLQRRVEALAETAQTHRPGCSRCGQPMRCHGKFCKPIAEKKKSANMG
jgi:hypothetical protein